VPASASLDRAARRRAVIPCTALLALIVMISGCAPEATVQPVLAERCLQLGGPQQQITVAIPVGGAGLLHVAIRERGISVVAAMEANGTGGKSASPVDRLGIITLATELSGHDIAPRHVVPVLISSVDSRDIAASVCVSAEITRPTDGPLASAERLMAAADQATGRRQWQSAFERYLAAARLFDGLGMPDHAAAARHSIAELEFGYMRRERDSMALAAAILPNSATAPSEIIAARLTLIAKALIQQADDGVFWARRTEAHIHMSDSLLEQSNVGTRERPRLKILRGYLHYRRGEPKQAADLFYRAAEECSALEDWECFARARQNLAALAEDQQNYPAALSAYSEAIRTLDASRQPMLYADISDNLGRLQGRVGLIRLSEQSERTAMRLYAQLRDCDGARRTAATLGEMLVRIGSIGEAPTYLNEALAPECRALLSSLPNISYQTSLVRLDSDQIPSSSSRSSAPPRVCFHTPTFDDLTLSGEVAVFHALLAESEIAKIENRLADAQRCLDLAGNFVAGDLRSRIRLASAKGQLMLHSGMLAAARTAFAEALRLAEGAALSESSEYRGAALLGLADTELQMNHFGNARSDAEAALWLSSERADVIRVVSALRVIAAVDRKLGHIADAERLLRSSIQLIERIPMAELDPETRAVYLATQHTVYAELTDLLLSERRGSDQAQEEATWNAFVIADGGHARGLRFALEQATSERMATREGAGAQEYRNLMRSISDLTAHPAHGSNASELLQGIEQLSLSGPARPALDEPKLAQTLRQHRATLIEYAAGRGSLFAFVADDDRVRVVELGDIETIDQAAAQFIAQLRAAEPAPQRIRAAARRLAKLVLWPITPFIRREHIFVVPEDALHTIPFAAIPWSSGHPDDMLLRHGEVSILPSALFLELRAQDASQHTRSGRYVLIGDPVFRYTTWRRDCSAPGDSEPQSSLAFDWLKSLPSLPATRDEVLAVAGLVRSSQPSASVVTLLGCAATPAALRAEAPEAELLHIATHGLVDAHRPRLSTLAFTPDSRPPDDGAVQLLDILGMKLQAHLVVLSACDTSAGRLLPGEGVLGLAQAFLQSGAESVMASYWRVADERAARFMETFYRRLLVDRLPAATALRRAQLAEANADDYSWAAFALYGRPEAGL